MLRLTTSFLAVVFSAALFISCNSEPNTTPTVSEEEFPTIDLSARDTTIHPGDDFFAYANGTWLKNNEIPASKTGWGSFFILRDEALHNMHEILDSCAQLSGALAGSPEQLIGDFYASLLDSAAIEESGIEPIKTTLMRIQDIEDKDDVMAEIISQYNEGSRRLFMTYVFPDDKQSDLQRLRFRQGGLGLPNRDYYFKTDVKSVETREKYKNYIATLLKLNDTDSDTAKNKAEAILALETELAQASKSPVELRDPESNYNLMSVTELDEISPNFDWINTISKFNVHVDTVLVGQPEFFKAASELISSQPIEVWKDYLTFHYMNEYADVLSSDFSNAKFDFYAKHLNGQKEPEERWKEAAGMVNNQLGDALGEIYVKKFFPPEAKERMLELVHNLQDAYRERIQNLSWMGDATKAKALEKLNAFTVKIGYPDKWKDYAGVEINRHAPVKNLQEVKAWHFRDNMAKLGKPVDKTEWRMTAPTVNAYYSAIYNEIVFPAGILQPPFFFAKGDDALNYGAIGAVIGHEMTHGFDDKGSQYDAEGNLTNWWSDADRENFSKLTNRVVEQYNNYHVFDTVPVNGELTQGENIADHGGLAIAYHAFKMTDQGKSGEKIDGLTPDQRFFLAFGGVWRIKSTDERMMLRINTDPHSPEIYRVNGTLANMPEFYEAFGVDENHKMYLPDSLRTIIW